MGKKINVAELLKGCPTGMELDCTMYDNLYFDRVDTFGCIKCYIKSEDNCLTSVAFHGNGCYNTFPNAKCVIFPKGKTTWEGFQRPFKDGDIVALGSSLGVQVFIFKEYINAKNNHVRCYVMLDICGAINIECGDYCVERFATEEEKEALFKAIKNEGYTWNAETKVLEKLVNMEDKEINNFNVLPGLYKCVHRMFDGTPDGKLLFEVGNIYKCLSKHDRAEFEVSYGHSIYLVDPVVCKHFIPFEKQGEQKSNPCEKCNLPTLEAMWEERVDNANKIQKKFKVGDRIKNKNSGICDKVIKIFEDCYLVESGLSDRQATIGFDIQDNWILVPNELVELKFKIGDKVRHRGNYNVVFTITDIEEDYYVCGTSGTKAAFWFIDQDYYELVLNELIKSKFHEGDWITNGEYTWKVISVDYLDYTLQNQWGECVYDTIDYVNKAFHLWTINDAKEGDVLFHSDSASNGIFIFKEILQRGTLQKVICYCDYDSEDGFCLGENHTCCWADSKILYPATKEQCDLLFQKMKEAGYKWVSETKTLARLILPKFKVGDKVRHKNYHNVVFIITNIEEDYYICGAKTIAFRFNDQDNYELVPNKFDISTLIPFESRVLVRDYNNGVWRVSFWGCLIDDNQHAFKYDTTRGCFKQCIPYKGNEHLLGKVDKCDDYYKTWE